MVTRRPGAGELLAGASGILLLLAMFLPWFGLNGRARVPGSDKVITLGRDNLNAWEAFSGIDVLLALTAVLAIAVLVVALVTTPPAELAAATSGAAALGALLIVYRLIDVPDIPIGDAGETAYETGRRLGAFFGLICTAGIAWGAGRAGAAAAERAAAAAAPAPAKPAPAKPAPAKPARPAPAPEPARRAPAPAQVAPASPATAPGPPAPAPAPARPPRRPARPAPVPSAHAASTPAEPAPPAPAPPAPVEPAPAVPAPTPPAERTPAPVASPLPGPLTLWTRAAIEAECQAPWRRYDRRLGNRYARYFEEHPDLAGEQRTSARDLVAALPPGWEAPAASIPDRPWQRHHLSAKSSQMLGVGLLGVAASRDPSLAWLWEALGPLPRGAENAPSLQFEHTVTPALLGERPRQTSFDVLVDDPAVLIGIQTKWREHGVGACRCRGDGVGPLEGQRCSRRVEQSEAYWDAAADLLGAGSREPGAACPISPVFEIVRHVAALRALAGDRPAVLALIYDADNPYFKPAGNWPGWPDLLAQAIHEDEQFRFVSVSWQELTPLLPLDEPARTWAADKHGLGQLSTRSAG